MNIIKILAEIRRIINKYFYLFLSKRKYRFKNTKLKNGFQLYKTIDGLLLFLNKTSAIDISIRKYGLWEERTTKLIKRFTCKSDIVIDVGANNGYFTTLIAKLVGPSGHVYSFEPTIHYHKVLNENVNINKLNNVTTYNYGLSNKIQDLRIYIDSSTATMHQPIMEQVIAEETIKLDTFDHWVEKEKLSHIDLIKVDIDGHEPYFIDGALNSIKKFKPIIILEVSALHFFQAGRFAWDFYDKMKGLGFYIYSEYEIDEITDKTDFLIKCCNFAYSTNIILSYNKL